MKNYLETELYKAAAVTFEEFGFMLGTSRLNEEQRRAGTNAAVSITFRGAFQGRLVVTICGDLLPTLAANMLGEEAPPSESQQRDALGEIANVICGNMLPGIAGAKAIFNLSAPAAVAVSQVSAAEPPTAEAHIGLERGRADLLLYLNGNPEGWEKDEG